MEEWLIPELKEIDIAKDATATHTMNLPVGEFAHTVTKEDISQFTADTKKAVTKQLNNLGELIKSPRKVKRTKRRKQEKELQL